MYRRFTLSLVLLLPAFAGDSVTPVKTTKAN